MLLCAACCLLPIAAVTFSVGALTALSACLEWAGILAVIVVVVFLRIYFSRNGKPRHIDAYIEL